MDPTFPSGPVRGPEDLVTIRRLAFIALGSNLGERVDHLKAAARGLSCLPETRVVACSSMFETKPMGAAQYPFVNAVLALDTVAAPRPLLDVMLQLERSRGRVRGEKWGPRTLDLDLLAMLEGGQSIELEHPELTLPHPGIAKRDFVLAPLLEIAPWLSVGPLPLGHYLASLPAQARTIEARHAEPLLEGAPFGVSVPLLPGG